MKAGSIVVCLPVSIHDCWTGRIKWLPVMDQETPYLLREVNPTSNGGMGVLFEEGTIGYNGEGNELCFPADYVREILPSDNIMESIMEMVEEIKYEEV